MTPSTFRAIRKNLGLTQQEMGEALHYTGKYIRMTVQRIEAGKRGISPRIEALVKVLVEKSI